MNIMWIFERFPTQEDCIAHLEQARWGGDPICPYCGSANTTRQSTPPPHNLRKTAPFAAFDFTIMDGLKIGIIYG